MSLERLILLGLAFAAAGVCAAEPVSFTRDIAPVLAAKCLACHSAEKAKGGYRMHTFEAMLAAGSSKETPVVPGKPEESLLFQLVVSADEDNRMPQKDEPLSAPQISALRQWIEQGAILDKGDPKTALAVLGAPPHRTAPAAYPVTVPITALAFDASGEQLIASGYHEITIWNASNGTLVRRIGDVAERTFDLAVSPDGQWLAAASGTPAKLGEVKLFAWSNGEPARVLAASADAQLCVAFSPDGKRLAAGGADNTIRLWDLTTNAPSIVVEQNADWVLSIAFSPDSTRFVSASRDKASRIFSTTTGELDETYTGHGDFVLSAVWADDKSVVSASRPREVHRWNVKDAKKNADFKGWDAEVTRLIVAGTNLFSAALDGKVRQHVLPAKVLARTFEAHGDVVHALALHEKTQRLASGSHDGEVRVWDTEGELLRKFVAAPGYTRKLTRAP